MPRPRGSARPERTARPRPRRRTLISWPLYRLVLAISVIPVLLAVLLVRQPTLPPTPTRSLAFDGSAAATQSAALLALPPGRGPGEKGDHAAAGVVATKLRRDGYHIETQFFGADLPGRPNVALENVIGYRPGTGSGVIAVIAHRDGVGTGADDNASGTGVMLELARELSSQPRPARGMVFVSTDAGTTGGQGAAHFAETWAKLHRVDAAIVLDAIAAPDGSPIKIVLRADAPRGTSATVVGAVRRAIGTWGHVSADMPGALDQLTGLAVPYAVTEQGPLVARGVPAVTLTSGPQETATRPPFKPLLGGQLGRVGNAVINLVQELDAAPNIDPAGHAEIYLQSSVIRGILVELALAALLAPFIACVLDAVARCRRRRLPLAPGMAAFGWRCATWAVGLIVLWLLPLFPGNLASGVPVAPPGRSEIGLTWTGIAVAVAAALLFRQFVARPRIVPAGPVAASERTIGLVTALLGLVFASLAIVSVNPFALIIVLPAAHAWLWMEPVARHGRRAMLGLFVVGAVIGPLLVIGELWSMGLGISAFRSVLATVASGYFSPPLAAALAVALAAGAQLATVIAGRYAPARSRNRGYN